MTRILVALDVMDNREATRVAQTAGHLAKLDGAELHVVNVVASSGMSIVSSYLGPEHTARMVSEARNAVENFCAKALPGATLHVVEGTVYDQIIHLADKIKADLIVVGAHRPELRDYLIGPNAARVARHADQSVYVVR